MSEKQKSPKIAYLLKTFPRLSETFILNEILGLERLGMDIQIFSLKRPAGEEPVQSAMAAVKGSVTYVPALGPRSQFIDACIVVIAHLTLLLTETSRYVAAWKFHFGQPGRPRVKHFLQAGYLVRALRYGKFDHLHAHFANVPTSVAEVASRLSGIPYSFTAHAKDIYLTPAPELARKIKGAKCVLTCTAYNRRYLASLAPGATPVRLAYHGVDVSQFGAAQSKAQSGETHVPLILSVGRFCEKKGFDYLIQACRLLKDRGRPFRCEIVGYGELQGKLERMIRELDLGDCVRMAGTMTHDQLVALYPQASMFVLPCVVTGSGDRDGIPNVLIEAMVSGTPVISTRVSGISELVEHMENGLLVEQRNPQAVTDAMELLLVRADLRSRLAESAQEMVRRRFALETSARHVHDLLNSVIDQKDEPGAELDGSVVVTPSWGESA